MDEVGGQKDDETTALLSQTQSVCMAKAVQGDPHTPVPKSE